MNVLVFVISSMDKYDARISDSTKITSFLYLTEYCKYKCMVIYFIKSRLTESEIFEYLQYVRTGIINAKGVVSPTPSFRAKNWVILSMQISEIVPQTFSLSMQHFFSGASVTQLPNISSLIRYFDNMLGPCE